MRGLRRTLASPSVILLAAVLSRFAYLLWFFLRQPGHSGPYLVGEELGSIAASIVAGHGFSSPLYGPSGPTAWSTPVFPCLLALIFKIFGTYTLQASIIVRSLNALFSALTVIPLVLTARRLFGSMVGSAAGWIWVMLPMAITLPIDWVWEMSLAGLLLSTALWATYELQSRTNSSAWALFGMLWGVLVLTSAAALSIFPGCFAFAVWNCRKRTAQWLRSASLAALSFALVLAPWIIRNQLTFHGQVLLRSNFGLELWLGNNPEVPDTWSWWLHPLDSRRESDEFFRLGEVAYMQEKRAAAIQFIRTHPSDAARFQFHRFLETWTGHSDSFADVWSSRMFSLRADLLLNYCLTLFSFVGLLLTYRRMPLMSLPLVNVLFFFPLVYYLCHTTPRYRYPIDPLMAILSAYTLTSCLTFLRDLAVKRRASVLPATLPQSN